MGDINTVLADYKNFINSVQNYSLYKVSETVSDISTTTNSLYGSDDSDQRVQLRGKATNFKVLKPKGQIDGYVYANKSKELIYLEFGTRQTNRSSLRIDTSFKSGIPTINIAAPYKVDAPFFHKQPIQGRYYFLNTIDIEGVNFLKTFGK
jgi:hypothetical protein